MMNYDSNKGFGLIEFLVAATIFSLGIGTVMYLVLDANATTRQGVTREQAINMAQESLEAVRSIRDNNIEDVVVGTHGLAFVDNAWEFSGSQDVQGIFTRTVTVTDVGQLPYDINDFSYSCSATHKDPVCHNGNTIYLPDHSEAIPSHEAHGDTVGVCAGDENDCEGNTIYDNGHSDDGTINICVILLDQDDEIISGEGYAEGISMNLYNQSGEFSKQIFFDFPLDTPNTDILSDIPGNDAFCGTETGLEFQRYLYDPQSFANGAGNWEIPLYNDQYTDTITTMADFVAFNPSDRNADGGVDVWFDRPERSLFVLNRLSINAQEGYQGTDGTGGYLSADVSPENGTPEIKEVTATISWQERPGKNEEVSFTQRLSNWNKNTQEGEAENFYASADASEASRNDKSILGVTVGNNGDIPITLDKMRLTYTFQTQVREITIAGASVWRDYAYSGQIIDIEDVVLEPGQVDVPVDEIRWLWQIAGIINIEFIMIDGSSVTVSTPPL